MSDKLKPTSGRFPSKSKENKAVNKDIPMDDFAEEDLGTGDQMIPVASPPKFERTVDLPKFDKTEIPKKPK